MRLSAAVMTHPARVSSAERLRDRLPELNPTIVVDPAPGEGPSARRTARLAWQAVADDATHHLVLQDDAVPCAGFPDHLARAIAACPDRPLSLHTEWGSKTSYAVRLAALLGSASTEVVDHYVPDIGLVLPAELARGCARFAGSEERHSDVAVREYLSAVGVSARITVPNLIEHGSLPSLTGHGYQGERPSVCFRSDVDNDGPDAGSVVPPALPVFSWLSGHAFWVAPTGWPGHSWSAVDGRQIVRRFGLHQANLASRGRATVRPWVAAMPELDPKALLGLWLTAHGLGVLLARLAGPDPARLDAALARPTVRRALATMPGGALRVLVDRRRLAEAGDDLYRLVECGLRQGHTAVRHVGLDPHRR